MKLPLVSRAYHEERVAELKRQITGLAMALYPDGVPQEMQLLLGIAPPVMSQPTIAVEAEEVEPEPNEEQQEAEQKDEDMRRLMYIRRAKPSLFGAAMSTYMQRETQRKAKAAHPTAEMFTQARAEALKGNGYNA